MLSLACNLEAILGILFKIFKILRFLVRKNNRSIYDTTFLRNAFLFKIVGHVRASQWGLLIGDWSSKK